MAATALVIDADTILDELMVAHKEAIAVFIRRKMMCIGCPVARIHDVREACAEHGIPIEEFIAEVIAVVSAAHSGAVPDE